MATKKHLELVNQAKAAQKEINTLKSKSIALSKEEVKSLEDLIKKQKVRAENIRAANAEVRKAQLSKLESLASEERSIGQLGAGQKNLADSQAKANDIASGFSKGSAAQITKISELNRSIANLDVSESAQLISLMEQRTDAMKGMNLLGREAGDAIREQNSLAEVHASMTKGEKQILEGQATVLEGISKTIQGAVESAVTLYGNLTGAIGGLITGFGHVVGKIGEANTELGTSMFQTDGVARKAGLLSLVFSDAVGNAKALSAELGDTGRATFEAQANIGLISMNMGISGQEAATLTGSFARLNGNSASVATDMIKTSSEFAKQNGIIPAQLMGDLANSAEEFALFGKEGGKNILEAAGYAAKLGVNMKTLSGVADGLLDFETSITKELELGAMLGKNINLNKARELAYNNDIKGAVGETLKQVGGITAFNKMDYYQKKQTADLLGVSVDEFKKMATNQEQAGKLGGIMNEQFSAMGELVDGGLNKYLGTSIKGLGGMVTAAGQTGLQLKGLGIDMGGMIKSSAQVVKNLAKMAASKVGGMLGGAGGKLGSFAGKIGEKIKGSGVAKKLGAFKDKATEGIGDKIKTPDTKAAKPAGGVGKSLKSLASGLKAMGNAKVLFGALNLIPTALGMVAMIAAIPGLLALSLMGVAAGVGLRGLGSGLSAFGKTVSKALPQIGIGLLVLAAFGAAMIPLGYALGLAAPAISAFGDILKGAFEGIASIVTAVSGGLIGMLDVITLEKAVAMGVLGYSFIGLAVGISALGIASLLWGGTVRKFLTKTGEALGSFGSEGVDNVTNLANALVSMAGGLASVVTQLDLLDTSKLDALADVSISASIGGAISGIGSSISGLISGLGESGGESETSGLNAGSLSEYELLMEQKMKELITATMADKTVNVYLNKEKFTAAIMDESERNSVNKFRLNRA